MRWLRYLFPTSLLAVALGCGGAGGAGPASFADGADETGQSAAGPDDQQQEPAAENTGAAESSAASEQPDPPSVPTSEADCMEFQLKMIECGKAAGGLGPSEKAAMRSSAETGCRAAIEDRQNPVTAHVLRLWARCASLPCAEAEECFRGGLTELSAPPGPYLPAPQ